MNQIPSPGTSRGILPLVALVAVFALLTWVLPSPGTWLPALLDDSMARMWLVIAAGVAVLGAAALVLRTRQFQPRGAGRASADGVPPPTRVLAQSHVRSFTAERPSTRFRDVAGVDEAKEELAEVVEFLRHPAKFAAMGARIPRGVLLAGPPGTGKTLLARAVAGEAEVPFLSVSGSEFVELYVGVGAARVRALFQEARRLAPCIVFIDEIDAVGRRRGANFGMSHEEREQTLNQILVEMDGFDARSNVIVIAATNRPDVLDPALLRPGRFDRQVTLDRPDCNGRLAILRVHAAGKRLDPSVDLQTVARQTPGLSGADLENLINEAAILAARRDAPAITMAELEEALDRVVAGPQRRSRVISPRERAITAYHEVGHALVAHHLPHADRVHKISIVARGAMGGYTRLLPDGDRALWSRSHFQSAIACALGGLVAEELIFGETTTGASDDLQRASEIARKMVCEYGMSDALGPVAFTRSEAYLAAGAEGRAFGDDVARRIDREVERLILEGRECARRILSQHHDRLVAVAELLLEREVLAGEEMLQALGPGADRREPRAEPARRPADPAPSPRPVLSPAPAYPLRRRHERLSGAALPLALRHALRSTRARASQPVARGRARVEGPPSSTPLPY